MRDYDGYFEDRLSLWFLETRISSHYESKEIFMGTSRSLTISFNDFYHISIYSYVSTGNIYDSIITGLIYRASLLEDV